MPDIPNRDELERKIARLLGRFNKTQLGDLLEMMGNSPKMNKIPPSFWTESEQALAAELVPFSEMVYLEAAERVVDSVPLPIGFDWTLVNQDAADWAIREVGKLVTKITDTTRKRIGSAVSSYFTETQTIGDLEKQLARMKDRFGNILGPKRAEMISVTEITRAASQGELGVARQLKNEGIEMRKVWQTNKDDLVCTICEPLQGVEESTWRSVAPDGPPAHVRCRCFLSLLLPKVTEEQPINISEQIREYEADKTGQFLDHEVARIYDKNGNVILEKGGDTSSVAFTDDEIAQMKGTILTHNHPANGPFSTDDILFMNHAELQEIRATAGTRGTYSMKRNNLRYSQDNLRDSFDRAIGDARSTHAATGYMNWNGFWEAVADRTGFTFTVEK